MIRLDSVQRVQARAGETLVYIGRGRVPAGMEGAGLGNPFKVGEEYAQGEAAAAYLDYLRTECRKQGRTYQKIRELAQRLASGEHLVLVCWCSPKPCHGEHILAAVRGYAIRDFGYQE